MELKSVRIVHRRLQCDLMKEEPVEGRETDTGGLQRKGQIALFAANGKDDLSNVDTCNGSVRLAPCTTHSSLQSIGPSARQHFVDADDVVRVSTNAQMERFLATDLDQILVGADTGGLEGLGAQLLILVRDKVDAQREVVNSRTLATQVEDADLRVGHTAVESRLGVRL